MVKYDRCDPDKRILRLVSIGHHLWSLRRKSGTTDDERMAIDAALETVWEAKQQLEVEAIEEKRIKWQEFQAEGGFSQ